MKLMDFVNKEYFKNDDKFNECINKLKKMEKASSETRTFCLGYPDCLECVFKKWCDKDESDLLLDDFLEEENIIKNEKDFYDYFIPSLILEYKNYKSTKSDIKVKEVKPNKIQGVVPNNHYKSKIEPLEYIIANNFDFVRGNIIKYASRAGKKKGEEKNDIKKIIDYALILAIQEGINIDFEELKKVIDYRKEWKK